MLAPLSRNIILLVNLLGCLSPFFSFFFSFIFLLHRCLIWKVSGLTMKSREDEERALMWYSSFRVNCCESPSLSPFTSESFQTLRLKCWKKKNNLTLKMVLTSAKATAGLIPPCEAMPPGFLLLVLPQLCVSDSHGEGSPTGHPYGTAARAANGSVVRG